MDNRNTQLINTFYNVETALKAAFILMSLFNAPYTLLVAFASSLIGVLRVCKQPQMSRQYLARVLNNNHGQNLLYISFGASGHTNYLYYAPIALFFGYGIVEYIKMKYPQNKYSHYVDMVRNNKFYVFETKAKLQIIFVVYLIVTLPFDLLARIVKVFLMGQLLVLKYKMNNDFRLACASVNSWILQKTSGIQALNSAYLKISGWLYGFASRDMVQ